MEHGPRLTTVARAPYIALVKNENHFHFSAPVARSHSPPRAARVLGALADAGYSDTASRRAVVEALCDARGGATPSVILDLGRRSHPHLGQVTVYRTLEILEQLGLARKIHAEDGCSSWVATTGEHAHHVICRRCRKAVEFEECSLGPVVAEVARRTGFTVEGHWLELFGLCPSCRRKQ